MMDDQELEARLLETAEAVKNSNIGVHACLYVVLGCMKDGSIPELVHYLRIFASYRKNECQKEQASLAEEIEILKLFGGIDE